MLGTWFLWNNMTSYEHVATSEGDETCITLRFRCRSVLAAAPTRIWSIQEPKVWSITGVGDQLCWQPLYSLFGFASEIRLASVKFELYGSYQVSDPLFYFKNEWFDASRAHIFVIFHDKSEFCCLIYLFHYSYSMFFQIWRRAV